MNVPIALDIIKDLTDRLYKALVKQGFQKVKKLILSVDQLDRALDKLEKKGLLPDSKTFQPVANVTTREAFTSLAISLDLKKVTLQLGQNQPKKQCVEKIFDVEKRFDVEQAVEDYFDVPVKAEARTISARLRKIPAVYVVASKMSAEEIAEDIAKKANPGMQLSVTEVAYAYLGGSSTSTSPIARKALEILVQQGKAKATGKKNLGHAAVYEITG